MIKVEIKKLLQGRSLYWLSTASGVRWATVAALAKGKAQRVDLDVLESICRALEATPGDLLSLQPKLKTTKRK